VTILAVNAVISTLMYAVIVPFCLQGNNFELTWCMEK